MTVSYVMDLSTKKKLQKSAKTGFHIFTKTKNKDPWK